MSTNSHTAYPLAWPFGWPRTSPRHQGTFKTDTAKSLANLRRQLNIMGAKEIILSSNYTLGVENPQDPGVVAYFSWDGLKLAIPCDRWVKISHNIQAIALSVEAMRGMDRWGAKQMIRAMFSGFKQLPEGSTEAWWKVLGVDHNSDAADIKSAYLKLVQEHHPDKGGEHEAFVRIQRAFDTARQSGLVS